MHITKKDKRETIKVGEIIKKVDRMDGIYIHSESDKIFQWQPFLLSMILGYRQNLKEDELEEITKIVFIIWEFFKGASQVNRKKITEIQFERIQLRNIHMLKYFEGEPGYERKIEVIEYDFIHLNSKALLSGIMYLFNTRNSLIKMNKEKKGIVIIGLKSLIECLEENDKV